jgi:hypothetical protein
VPPTDVPPTSPLDDPDFVAGLRAVPTGMGDGPVPWTGADLAGVDPAGRPVAVGIGGAARPVLVVFLSVDCDGCDLFWRGLRERPPAGVEVAVVTRSPGTVPADGVAALADGLDAPVVMSEEAWGDFRVTGYPFLVVVEPGTRRILGETVGFGWSDVADLLTRCGVG